MRRLRERHGRELGLIVHKVLADRETTHAVVFLVGHHTGSRHRWRWPACRF